jgi:preprotein translocase subunit SecF
VLHNFALALTIGILFGIYSSVLVACPIAMWLGVSRANLIGDVEKKEDASKAGKKTDVAEPHPSDFA